VAQPAKPVKPKPPLTLADLPAECRTVVGDDAAVMTASGAAPAKKNPTAAASKTAATAEKKPTIKKAADAK
jgi:hypothetical protein